MSHLWSNKPDPRSLYVRSWRAMLRRFLRECAYLPDPVARYTVRIHVLERFRRYHGRMPDDIDRLNDMQKSAERDLSILKRANDGYTRPLEKVLRFAYGRSGKRKWEMLAKFVTDDVPQNSDVVTLLLKKPTNFSDEWKPPQIVIDLLKSQNDNPVVQQLNTHRPVRDLEPRFPKSAWGAGDISARRRKNIRRKWYGSVLESLLPPLPDTEMEVLEGLISGTIPWELPQPRKTAIPEACFRFKAKWSKYGKRRSRAGELVRAVLTDGPKKEGTFEPFANGRPHTITRRFMCRLWNRISGLVPRPVWDPAAKKYRFNWETVVPLPTLAVSAKEDSSDAVFGGADSQEPTPQAVSTQKKRQGD